MRSLLAATLSVNFIIQIVVTSAINNTNFSSVNMSNYRVKVCNVIEVSQVNTAIKDLETKLENLITQNLETNLKLENLSTQVNKTIKNLETKLENLEQRTIHQNLEMNLKLEKLIALINKTSSQQPIPPAAVPASSCKEQYEKHRASKSQVYELIFGSQKIPVYCHMGNFGCGDGGWTPAMKIDGTKTTFHYDSHQWRNRSAFNLAGGKTGFDAQETKLPTYWNTPFSKICLGMKIGHDIKFVVINRNANSLYSLIADGQYRVTSLGRNTWKALIGSQASLQPNCNKEGFNVVTSNVYSKARIGILGNDQNGCSTCESRIGFGTGGYPDYFSTCGNEATTGADNGNKHIKAMGYILVQ